MIRIKVMCTVLFVCGSLISTLVTSSRTKRAAYDLPDGADLLVGGINTDFQCPQNQHGYFADVSNDCKLFHICHPVTHADGRQEMQHFTFACGNQTMFNQLTLTCAFPEESVPCSNAPDFFYINDNIGVQDAPLHTENDIERAQPLIPGFPADLHQRTAAAFDDQNTVSQDNGVDNNQQQQLDDQNQSNAAHTAYSDPQNDISYNTQKAYEDPQQQQQLADQQQDYQQDQQNNYQQDQQQNYQHDQDQAYQQDQQHSYQQDQTHDQQQQQKSYQTQHAYPTSNGHGDNQRYSQEQVSDNNYRYQNTYSANSEYAYTRKS